MSYNYIKLSMYNEFILYRVGCLSEILDFQSPPLNSGARHAANIH